MRKPRLTVEQRRDVFRILVRTQDVLQDVPRSREIVMQKFDITEAQVRRIEEEGLEREWLDEVEADQVLAG